MHRDDPTTPRSRPVRARSSLRWLLGGALLLGLTLPAVACKPHEETRAPLTSESAEARANELAAYLAEFPEDTDAWRDLAHLYWLHTGAPEEALTILDMLADRDDLTGRASRMLIADARLDPKTAREQAMTVIRRVGGLEDAKTAPAQHRDESRRHARRYKRAQRRRAPRPALTELERRGFAELAARVLEQSHGEVPGDDERFIAFFDELDQRGALERLPATVTRPLLSVRAQITRRKGEDYRQHYRRQGCVDEWAVGPVEGTFGALELRRLEPQRGAFTFDAGARLTALSCVVRVWNPTPRAGVRRMQTVVTSEDGTIELELAAQEPTRVYLDGALLHRSDRADRWPADRARYSVAVSPGPHQLEVRVAIPKDRAWVMVRATDGVGRPLTTQEPRDTAWPEDPVKLKATRLAPTFTEPLAPPGTGATASPSAAVGLLSDPIYRPLRHYLGGMNALADGDTDRAETAARALSLGYDRFAEGSMFVAAFEADDPSRERTASKARQRRALEQAVELDPALDRARVRLLEMSLERGELAEVIEALEAMAPGELRGVEGELLRFRAYMARGNEHAAEEALARASALHPKSCAVLNTERMVARGRSDVRREDAIVEQLVDCPGTLGLRARLAYRRGDTKQATALLEERLTRTPDDVDALTVLGDIAVTEERYRDALAYRRKILELTPYAGGTRIAAADLEARVGQTQRARAEIEDALRLIPYSSALHEIAEHVGIGDDLLRFRVDGAALLRDFRAAPQDGYEGASEVLVLDRSVARVYADGSLRQIVHTITELRTKEAIDRYGEIELPDSVRVLTLHSIKPDGTVVEPEQISGKDGLSLRGLAPGDAVEQEFIVDSEPNPLLPGYLDIGRFSFQSRETPFNVSETLVVSPPGVPLQIERRGGAPEHTREDRDGLEVRRWRVTKSPRLGVEPAMRALVDEVPSVRVFTQLEIPDWLETLTLQLYEAQRSNPELRRLARELVADAPEGAGARRAKLELLHDWVLTNIEDTADISTPATMTLSAKQGSRLMLLKALLREAGVKAELWVGRDRFGPSAIKGGHPMVESFAAPTLAVWADDDDAAPPVIVLANSRSVPIGYMPAGLARSEAVRIRLDDDEGAPGVVSLPDIPDALRDRRSHELEVELDATGAGTITGTLELQGMEAIVWRDELRKIDRDRLPEGFERAELSRLFRGSTIDVQSLELLDEDERDKPLRIQFTASIRGAAARQGKDLVLPSAVVPMNLAFGFTTLPQRQTGLVIPYGPLKTARVTVRLLGGATFKKVPEDISIKRAHGTYSRTITDGGAGASAVTIETRATLIPGVVEAARYPELVALTREIDVEEDEVLRAR